MNNVITAQQLSKRFGDLEPVKHVSFTVMQGEFVTLLGPSGSGKSTLLALAAGLETVTSGRISLYDRDLSRMSEDELALMRREHVGFVFQSFHLIGSLTALENVAFPLYPVKMTAAARRERAQELLTQVGLADRAANLPSHLSGGERQRVAIARALVNRPGLIFCDEPTGNLDSASGKEILNLLLDLNTREQMTIFMVTHDTAIAQLSHRSLTMKDGEVTV
jgi:putative ABC transport system ATP-binding protein